MILTNCLTENQEQQNFAEDKYISIMSFPSPKLGPSWLVSQLFSGLGREKKCPKYFKKALEQFSDNNWAI